MKTTPRKIYTRIALVAHQKLKENDFKKNILDEGLTILLIGFIVEGYEFIVAFLIYRIKPTISNKNKMDLESGDVLNFLAAIIAKTDGYKQLMRNYHE